MTKGLEPLAKTKESRVNFHHLTPNFEKVQKWKKALPRIKNELQRLEIARKVYVRWSEIIDANKELQKSVAHLFFEWVIQNYCVRLGMGIRRLVDKRSDELNIYKLLEEIEGCVQCINVNSHIIQHNAEEKNSRTSKNGWHSPSQADYEKVYKRAIKEALGARRKIFSSNDVRKDKDRIQKIAKKPIERFVNETWAHLGKKKIIPPTIKQAHECLDVLISIYNKYALLLCEGKLHPLSDKMLFAEWDTLFKMPWKA